MPGTKDLPGSSAKRITLAAMTGATADDEFAVFVAENAMKITGVNWVPDAAVTHSGTNYTVLSVRNRKADASGSVLPWSRSYVATDSTALVKETGTLSSTASDLLLNAGDVITVQRLHTASGLALPAGVVEILVQNN